MTLDLRYSPRSPYKVGEPIEYWMWADGRESPEVVEQYRKDVIDAINATADKFRLVVSPPQFKIKRPGDDRVPEVPKHIHGPDVRLIGAQALVIGECGRLRRNSFLGDLDLVDLERLRIITRRKAKEMGFDDVPTAEVDALIEELGPEVAYRTVRDAVEKKTLQ